MQRESTNLIFISILISGLSHGSTPQPYLLYQNQLQVIGSFAVTGSLAHYSWPPVTSTFSISIYPSFIFFVCFAASLCRHPYSWDQINTAQALKENRMLIQSFQPIIQFRFQLASQYKYIYSNLFDGNRINRKWWSRTPGTGYYWETVSDLIQVRFNNDLLTCRHYEKTGLGTQLRMMWVGVLDTDQW